MFCRIHRVNESFSTDFSHFKLNNQAVLDGHGDTKTVLDGPAKSNILINHNETIEIQNANHKQKLKTNRNIIS